MHLSEEAFGCLNWRINYIERPSRPINLSKPGIVIESDSTLTGCEAIDKTFHSTFSGLWSESDSKFHINVLEMKTAF